MSGPALFQTEQEVKYPKCVAAAGLAAAVGIPASARAQDWLGVIQLDPIQVPMPASHQHGQETAVSGGPLGISAARDGAGTAWLPDASPGHGLMRHAGPWMLMFHGNAFIQYLNAGSDRGDRQFGSVNWFMATAERTAAGGQLQIRSMISAEAATVGRCGYPLLLQSGEACQGEQLHDRQHPHDVFMELAAYYRKSISQRVAMEVYGGPAGDPALGPVAFAHRPSALPNPLGPISHHWLDSSHISFGVLTAGLYGRRWKAEASVFNGREPDDTRWTIDLAALDSYSGRLSVSPSSRWTFQVSAGHLTEAEQHADGAREDVNRITASGTYHRLVDNRLWATTVAWGQNREEGQATNAFLIESSTDLTPRDVLFARAEVVQKTAHDLVVEMGGEVFTVQKYQAGYTRWFARAWNLDAGLGASAGAIAVPQSLASPYGGRVAGELAVFLRVRVR
ncbi:MAG TPA: hypothetical protein VFV78_11800 [Vicinamibacterales bacterium]|nr:hypothetical protein [Vicinamibacterales bacterium]